MLATVKNYEDVDDDVLVRRSIGGDSAATTQLVTRFLPRIWRVVYLNVGAASEVEDLVQTAMMTALENISSYRGPDRFRFWLDRVAMNVVRSHFRKRKLRRLFTSQIDPDKTISRYHHNDVRQLEAQQLFHRLSKHLARIGTKNRMALVLSLVHGYQAKEIAAIVNCSTEAAWKRTRRGYDELMTRVAKDAELDRNLKELFHA